MSKAPVCRYCYVPIMFEVLASGRKLAVNPDGSDHAAECVAQHRIRIADNVCARCSSDLTERLPGKDSHWAGLRCLQCGAHRWLRRPDDVPVKS